MKGQDMNPSSRAAARRDSLQHVRRMSNWTAAVLIAGTGTAAVALAHQASRAACHPLGRDHHRLRRDRDHHDPDG